MNDLIIIQQARMWIQGCGDYPNNKGRENPAPTEIDSLSDRIEVAIVTFLQKNPDSIYLEIEDDLYPRFPGLMTPSKGMIYAVLTSYAEKDKSTWKLRPEDVANARRNELNTITAMIEALGTRLSTPRGKRIRIIFGKPPPRTALEAE